LPVAITAQALIAEMAEPFPALARLIRLLEDDRLEVQIVSVNYNALTGALDIRFAVVHDVPVANLDVTVVGFSFINPP